MKTEIRVYCNGGIYTTPQTITIIPNKEVIITLNCEKCPEKERCGYAGRDMYLETRNLVE